VTVSLTARVIHRGPYVPGFDLLSAAQGTYNIATQKTADLLASVFANGFRTVGAWNVEGLPSTLVPGLLTTLWPWEYWAHVVTFVATAAALALLAHALRLGCRHGLLVVLGAGASSAFLSFSVTGFFYMSAILPHLLFLWAAMRARRRPLWALAASVVAAWLAPHVQELGRTVWIDFAAGALLLPRTRITVRAMWLLLGAWLCWQSTIHHTFNTSHYAAMRLPPLHDCAARLNDLLGRLTTLQIDTPGLLIAGALALLLIRRARFFWWAIVGAQLALLLLLAVNVGDVEGPNNVWPRRTLLLSFLLLAATATAYRERRTWRPVFIAILTAGMLWQVADTLRSSLRPLDAHAMDRDYFPLPYVHNTIDYTVPFALVDWSALIQADVDTGRRVVLLYNLLAYDENPTNPAGLLERLYLRLGHARFIDSVIVFGDDVVRWNRMPLRPMATLEAFVGGMDDREEWIVYAIAHPADRHPSWIAAQGFRTQTYTIMRALETRFVAESSLELNDRIGRQLVRFTLVPRVDPVAD